MIPEQLPGDILRNLSPQRPVDLDPHLFAAPRKAEAREVRVSPFPPSAAIWEMADETVSYIGVRVRLPIEQAETLAARLASIAVERQIYPVFLSYIPGCDMQRFGFRVEKLYGLSDAVQAQYELQLSRFWRFALIADASDIARLG